MKVLQKMLTTIVLITTLVILVSSESRAAEEFLKGHATAYCLQGTMASGNKVYKGACAMNSKVVREQGLMGKSVILYQRLPNGEVGKELGVFKIEDTGCKKNVIDVWMPDLNECQEFMNLVYEDGCKGKIYYRVMENENGRE